MYYGLAIGSEIPLLRISSDPILLLADSTKIMDEQLLSPLGGIYSTRIHSSPLTVIRSVRPAGTRLLGVFDLITL